MNRKDGPAPKIVYAGGYEGFGGNADHRHQHAWELIYLCEGSVSERLGKDVIEMRPGTFVVHPPGSVHGDTASGSYFLYHVLVTPEQPLGWPQFGNDLDGEPIRALLEMVVREWYSNGAHREAFLRHSASLLDLLMKRCAIQAEETQVARKVVAIACGYFRREFGASINMQDVACDMHISRSTLYTYFRQVLGRTPQEVLDSIRLKHAVYLLRHSELPIEEVAKGSGYYSSSHLGRKLRFAYQMSAGQIRVSRGEQEPGRPALKR